MTIAEFLDWDGGGHQGKLELIDGVVRAMAPASEAHGTIQANLALLIGQHLRAGGAKCRVVTEAGVVPRLNPGRNMRAPDLVVTCAPPDAKRKTVDEPLLLIEILSPSNENDTWESIRACATIPSVKEMLVVDSEHVHAQIFRKGNDGVWAEKSEDVEAGGTLRFDCIDYSIPLAEVYAGTALA
jgi:Uma2 family endonuclease